MVGNDVGAGSAVRYLWRLVGAPAVLVAVNAGQEDVLIRVHLAEAQGLVGVVADHVMAEEQLFCVLVLVLLGEEERRQVRGRERVRGVHPVAVRVCLVCVSACVSMCECGMCVCVHERVCAYVCAYMCVCVYVSVCLYDCVCVRACVHVPRDVCICVCMCLWGMVRVYRGMCLCASV